MATTDDADASSSAGGNSTQTALAGNVRTESNGESTIVTVDMGGVIASVMAPQGIDQQSVDDVMVEMWDALEEAVVDEAVAGGADQ